MLFNVPSCKYYQIKAEILNFYINLLILDLVQQTNEMAQSNTVGEHPLLTHAPPVYRYYLCMFVSTH